MLLLEDAKKNLLSDLEHTAKALSSDPGSAWMCVLECTWGLEVGGLGKGAQRCKRLWLSKHQVCGSVGTMACQRPEVAGW